MPKEDFQEKKGFQGDYSEESNFGFSGSSSSVGMPWRLMTFSFVLFAFSIFIFFGLRFGYEAYLNSQLESLNKEISQLTNEVSEDKQEEFLSFYSQFSNLNKVLKDRQFSHNVFDFLEKNTLPFVAYNEAEYFENTREVILKGAAQNMGYLVEQTNIFGAASEISRVDLASVNIFEGGVGFEIELIFSSNYFKNPI